jgi:hypothetical protein
MRFSLAEISLRPVVLCVPIAHPTSVMEQIDSDLGLNFRASRAAFFNKPSRFYGSASGAAPATCMRVNGSRFTDLYCCCPRQSHLTRLGGANRTQPRITGWMRCCCERRARASREHEISPRSDAAFCRSNWIRCWPAGCTMPGMAALLRLKRAEPGDLIFSVLPGRIQRLQRHKAAGWSPAAQSRNIRLSSRYTKGWRCCIQAGP